MHVVCNLYILKKNILYFCFKIFGKPVRQVHTGDLNTSLAVTAVYDVLKEKTNDGTKLAALRDFDRVLSLNLLEAAQQVQEKQKQEAEDSADPEIDALVARRTAAKKERNFAEADRIRDELKAMGVEIIDPPQGTKCRKA